MATNKAVVQALLLGRCAQDAVPVATFGDSTANTGTSQSPASQSFAVLTAPFPGSGATSLGPSIDKWALPLHYPKAYLVLNGGVSGETTTQMLARDQAVASATRKAITDVLNAAPAVVILRGGSINDVIADTAEDTTYANHVLLIERLLSGDVIVIDEGIYGYSAPVPQLAARQAKILSLNRRYAAYARDFPGRVFFLSPLNLLSSATGDFLPGMCNRDQVHLSQWGQYVLGRAEAAILTNLFGAATRPRFPGTNLVTNAMLANSGASGYGTVATGFAFTASSGTRQNAVIESRGGKSWQTCELLITGTAANLTCTMPYDPTVLGIQVGDVYGFEFDFFVEGPTEGSAPPMPSAIIGRVDTYKTAAGRVLIEGLVPSEYNPLLGVYQGRLVCGPLQFQEASAALTTSSTFSFGYTTAVNNGTVFKLGVSDPRVVKLPPTSPQLGTLLQSVIASGSAVALTDSTTANVTSLALPAGIWQVTGTLDFVLGAATSTLRTGGASVTSATLGAQDQSVADVTPLTLVTGTQTLPAPVCVLTLFAATTVYLVANAAFSAGTVSAYGTLQARCIG